MVCHGQCTQRLTLVTLNYSELMAYVKNVEWKGGISLGERGDSGGLFFGVLGFCQKRCVPKSWHHWPDTQKVHFWTTWYYFLPLVSHFEFFCLTGLKFTCNTSS